LSNRVDGAVQQGGHAGEVGHPLGHLDTQTGAAVPTFFGGHAGPFAGFAAEAVGLFNQVYGSPAIMQVFRGREAGHAASQDQHAW